MTTRASQITSLTVVYSTIYSDADQRKHQSSAWLAFVWGIHRDRWIPRTKGQLRGKCFHLMTSSCMLKLVPNHNQSGLSNWGSDLLIRLISIHSLLWRHNGHDGVSNHQPHNCLLNRLFRRISKKTSKLRVTGFVWGIHRGLVNSRYKWPVTRKMFPFDDIVMWKMLFMTKYIYYLKSLIT